MEDQYSKQSILNELQGYQENLDEFESDFTVDLGYTEDEIIQLIKDFQKTLLIARVFVGIAKEPKK